MRVLLDCNIWDLLAKDDVALDRITTMTIDGALTVVVPATIRRELELSPWRGIPSWFPTQEILDGVAVVGHSHVGECMLGKAEVYSAHLGESRKVADAVAADTADTKADVFVSNDNRARRRYARIAGEDRSIDYPMFRQRILGLDD